MQIINQRTATVPIASIAADPVNPNQGDIGAISESIQSSGFFGHVLVQESTGRIIAGAHRHAAARALGAAEIPVTFVDVDDEQARRIMLADNRTARLGADDPDRLAVLLQELAATPAALQGTGYDGDALDELLADLGQTAPELAGDPDAVPEVPNEPVSRSGDLWRCGQHLILCGDATVRADVARVLDGAQADMVWTDPPYGVGYQANESMQSLKARNRRTDGLVVENDVLAEPELERLLRAAFGHAWQACKPGAVWYVAAPPGPLHLIFGGILKDLAITRQTLIWLKQQFVLGRTDYHYRHEPIFYGWKEGAAHHFVDDRTQDSVWEIDRPAASPEHPTMKPVELVARAVRNSSRHGDIVFDPFAGSGTTAVACEQEGRQARLIDVDPCAVDVCVRRWEQLTGKTAVREQVGDDARVRTGA